MVTDDDDDDVVVVVNYRIMTLEYNHSVGADYDIEDDDDDVVVVNYRIMTLDYNHSVGADYDIEDDDDDDDDDVDDDDICFNYASLPSFLTYMCISYKRFLQHFFQLSLASSTLQL